MPKGRMLNKKISFSKKVAKLSLPAKLLWTWLIPHFDCEGRFYASPQIIKGQVCPYVKELTLLKIGKCVQEMLDADLIILYGDDNANYMQSLGFDGEQTIDKNRESPSIIPHPTPEQLQSNSRVTPAEVKLSKVKLSKVNKHGEQGSPELSTPVEKTNFKIRGGDPKTLGSVLNLPPPFEFKSFEKKIVQELVLFWNKSFPNSQIGNGDGRWGVFFNILRGEKGYEPGIDQEKIKGAILKTVMDNSKSPLNDPFVRFCDRVNNRYKYED